MLHDTQCREIIGRRRSALVVWWIMAAWAYEVTNTPIISDALFDEIAARLDKEWWKVEHRHKHLLDRKMLKSSLAINGQWPDRAVHAARRLIATR